MPFQNLASNMKDHQQLDAFEGRKSSLVRRSRRKIHQVEEKAGAVINLVQFADLKDKRTSKSKAETY